MMLSSQGRATRVEENPVLRQPLLLARAIENTAFSELSQLKRDVPRRKSACAHFDDDQNSGTAVTPTTLDNACSSFSGLFVGMPVAISRQDIPHLRQDREVRRGRRRPACIG